MAEENQAESNTGADQSDVPDNVSTSDNSSDVPDNMLANETAAGDSEATAVSAGAVEKKRAHRSQKVGAVVSDKMQKTVVVRVDRLVKHTKYRRYVRRTSKFMAHDELGATIGDKVRIVETRPMSARKRWRVIEIVQKAAK
jgi:small subunit ribosomal protein S17